MASTANRVIKNTSYLYIKMGITMFISLYITRLILNSLGASDFGIFNIVGGAISMLAFLNGSMAAATQRFMSYAEGENNESKKIVIFNSSIVLHLIIALFVGVLLEIGAFFLFDGVLNIPENRISSAKIIYHCAVLSTIFTILTVPYDAVINAHENMLYYAAVGVFESFLKLATAFIVVYTLSDKLIVYGIFTAITALIIQLVMRIYCIRHYPECRLSLRNTVDVGILKEMTIFAGWNALSSILGVLSQYGMGVVLNHFFGTIVNAAQGIANQISGQLGALSSNAMKAVNPVIVKSAGAHDEAMLYRSTILGSKALFFIMSICFLPILANLEPILKLWLVNIPQYTVIFIQLYFTVNLIDTLSICQTTAINGVGRIKRYSLFMTIINVIPFFGSLIMFSIGFTPEWYYVLLIVAAVCKLASRLFFAAKECKFNMMNMFVNDTLRASAAFLVSFGVAFFINQEIVETESVTYLLSSVIIGALFYFFVYIFFGFNQAERRYFYNVICSITKKIVK